MKVIVLNNNKTSHCQSCGALIESSEIGFSGLCTTCANTNGTSTTQD